MEIGKDNQERKAFIDSGAEANFIKKNIVSKIPKVSSRSIDHSIHNIDGSMLVYPDEARATTFRTQIPGFAEEQEMEAIEADIGKYDVVLGMPWLVKNNPDIDWKKRTITPRPKPNETAVTTPRNTVQYHATIEEAPEFQDEHPFLPTDYPSFWEDTGQYHALIEDDTGCPNEHPFLPTDYPSFWENTDPTNPLDSENPKGPTQQKGEKQESPDSKSHHPSRWEYEGNIDPHSNDYPIFLNAVVESQNKAKVDPQENPPKMLPEPYKDFAEMFDPESLNKLPPHRPGLDHEINLEPGAKLPNRPIYPTSPKEKKALKIYIDKYGRRGWIRKSSSPSASPIMFVDKKDTDDLRLCVDYRPTNKITKKNRYPVPLINSLIDKLHGARYFTRLDGAEAYHGLRIKSGDEWKTAFKCIFGLYEYLVMPFGLCNAGASYQAWVDNILEKLTIEELFQYLDDTLIWGKTREELRQRTREVLAAFKEAGIVLNLQKCEFEVQEISILGFIISEGKVHMDPKRIATISEWPEPKCVRDIQGFLGFANFYRRFIRAFSKICKGLSDLLKKDVKFNFNKAAQESFAKIKEAFCSEPVLTTYDPEKPSILRTDSSGYGICGIHLQKHDGKEHPVEFWSRKMTSAEVGYGTPDQELLAIVESMEHWRHHFEGANHRITIYSDHANLKYFLTTQQLSRRQAHWATKLSKYDFVIEHTPGRKNPADAPSRRPDYRDAKSNDNSPKTIDLNLAKSISIAFKDLPPGLQSQLMDFDPAVGATNDQTITIGAMIHLAAIAPALREELLTAQNDDEFVHKMKINEPEENDHAGRENWTFDDDILYFKTRAYIPQKMRTKVMEQVHDAPLAGHFGRERTRDLLAREYYWPGMTKDSEEYVKTCDKCHRNKTDRHAEYGLLQPQTVPERPWSRVGIDFITGLPMTENRNDAILVMVDYTTKMIHLDPCSMAEMTAEKTAKLVRRNIIRLHGVPDEITCDRGGQFVNKFAKTLYKQIGANVNSTTAYHPRANGQTERVNSPVAGYLRIYAENEKHWDEWTDLAEFTYNNSKHAVTKISPFYANHGNNPKTISQRTEAQSEFNDAAAIKHADKIKAISTKLTANLKDSKSKMKTRFDKTHIDMTFEPNEQVWLRTTNTNPENANKRQRPKLDARKEGPFTILEKVGPVDYKLDLSNTKTANKLHDTFHVSLLERYNQRDEVDSGRRSKYFATAKVQEPILEDDNADEDPGNEPDDERSDLEDVYSLQESDSEVENQYPDARVIGFSLRTFGDGRLIACKIVQKEGEGSEFVRLDNLRPYMGAVRRYIAANPDLLTQSGTHGIPTSRDLKRAGAARSALKIIDSRKIGGSGAPSKYMFKVRWNKGWGEQWQFTNALQSDRELLLIREFMMENPEAAGPTSIMLSVGERPTRPREGMREAKRIDAKATIQKNARHNRLQRLRQAELDSDSEDQTASAQKRRKVRKYMTSAYEDTGYLNRGQPVAEKCVTCKERGAFCDGALPKCGSCTKRNSHCFRQGEPDPRMFYITKEGKKKSGQPPEDKCERCRRNRKHCDGATPKCGACVQDRRRECVYGPTPVNLELKGQGKRKLQRREDKCDICKKIGRFCDGASPECDACVQGGRICTWTRADNSGRLGHSADEGDEIRSTRSQRERI